MVNSDRKILANCTLQNVTSAFLIDFISEYTPAGYLYYPVVAGVAGNYITLATLDGNYTVVNSLTTTTNYVPGKLKNITYSNFFKFDNSYNYLNFNLALKNYYNDTDVLRTTYSIPVSNLQSGIQSFALRFSERDGKYQIYYNGRQTYTSTFDAYKYRYNPIIKSHIHIGATGFHNNLSLSEFTQQPGYYYVNNLKLQGFKMYNQALEDYQILAINMLNQPIDNLTVSLPAGQKNSIEEVDRVFKFSQTCSWILKVICTHILVQ
ncbi:MAG: hypothetical protein EBU90_31740 [Proteobacteria bacterium]|nr:hypothetical protein [Pseudomonadota bacterium]